MELPGDCPASGDLGRLRRSAVAPGPETIATTPGLAPGGFTSDGERNDRRIAADESGKAASDLGDADAPSSLREDKQELQKAMRALSEEILGTVEVFDSLGPTAPITRAINFAAWNTVQAELADLRKAGIAVEPLARHSAESG